MKTPSDKPRALFVNPPSGLYRRDDRCQSRVEDQAVRVVLPPVDLALLASCARRAGYDCRIRDYPASNEDWAQYRSDLADFVPDIVLFNVTTATIDEDMVAARIAREVCPEARALARGEVFEREAEAILRGCPELDMALWGEPEIVFERLLTGEERASLPGLVWRDDAGQVVQNPGRPIVDDLDSLPLPARDLLDNTLYTSPETGRPLTTIKANRGCFARCVFCPAGSISDHRLRLRSPESVVREITECVENYQIRDFHFDGDTFTAKRTWVLDLCTRIRALPFSIRWGCNSRVDTMDAARARALADAGCIIVAFGIESGDQEMLDHMKKGTRVDQAKQAVAVCRAAGLMTSGFYIIGLPWETRASLNRTLRLMRELDTDLFDINIATPLPGTEFYEIAREEGLLLTDTQGSYAHAGVRSRALSADYLESWRKKTLLRLYARPTYIVRMLRRAARTGQLPRYVRAALGRLRSVLGF